MKRADDALYLAKDGGRDQVVVAEHERVEARPRR
jgi:PleD family two-component response regulator